MTSYAQRIYEALKPVTSATDYLTWDGDPDDKPKPGTTMSMGRDYSNNRYMAKDFMPDLIRVPVTTWGANCTALFEDFSQFFIMVEGGWDSHELFIPTYWQPDDEDDAPDDSLDMVLDVIEGLVTSYPLYRDESLSDIEMEEAGKAWEQYLSWDVKRSLTEAGVPDEPLDALDDETLERIWWDADQWSNQSPYLESATSIVFPEYGENVARMVSVVVEQGYATLLREATSHGQRKHWRDERRAWRASAQA